VNKTKKITNIHDYSKEVDKIIATGKPMVEQFMDLMGLMDVTFIDENQTSNRRLNKHDKSVQDKQPEKSKTERDKKNPVGSVLDKKPSTGKTEGEKDYRRRDSIQKCIPTVKGRNVDLSEMNRLKKRRKSYQNETSDCCGAKVLTVQGYPKDEGTHYWQCSKCGRPCNIMNPCGSQTKRKRDATTGSTAEVHLMSKGGIQRPNKGESYSHLSDTADAHLLTMAKTPQLDWRDKYLDKFGTTPHKGIEEFITELLNKKKRLKKTLKSSQNEVFGIGGQIDRFFLSGDDITLYKIKRFIRKIFLDILKHNQDPMTGLYDYDGIAQEVIDLVKK